MGFQQQSAFVVCKTELPETLPQWNWSPSRLRPKSGDLLPSCLSLIVWKLFVRYLPPRDLQVESDQ